MKLIKKICCLSVLFGCCMFFVMKNVNASDVVPLAETSTDGDYDSFIKEAHDEFIKNETSVENELSKMRDEYISKLDDIKDEKIKQSANEIINTLNECMISESSIDNFGYKGVMLTMIAFFNFKDWKLSAELLTHMMNNEDTDSLYYLDEVPTDVDNMLGNEKMVMKYSSERFDDCERKGKFGKYVYFLDIISGIKEEYEEVLYNSSNFYWTFYYEKHHSNGDTIFFMGVYLPDDNYLYLFERECHLRDFQFVEQN